MQHDAGNAMICAKNQNNERNAVMMIARGFQMTLPKFLNDPIFLSGKSENESDPPSRAICKRRPVGTGGGPPLSCKFR